MDARYTVPPINDLFDRVPNVRKNYHGKNPERIRLLDLFEKLLLVLKTIDRNEILLNDSDYHQLCFAAWLVFPIIIEVNKARFSTLGSLHNIFSNELNIEKLTELDVFDKLKQLNLIYHFVKENEKEFTVPFTLINSSVKEFLNQLLDVMRHLNHSFSQKINFLLTAIPCEKALDKTMQALPDAYEKRVIEKEKNAYIKYLNSAHDPLHKFLASLIRAISLIVPPDQDNQDNHFIPRSMRVKLGAILFTMLFIKDKYKVRDPLKWSILCGLSNDMLNGNNYDVLPPNLQADCIAAFNNLLDDNNNIKKLELAIDSGYIDLPIVKIKDKCKSILSGLYQPNVSTSYVTIGSAILGGVIGAIPCYGMGYTIGNIYSETNNTLNTKIEMSKLTGRMMTVMYGSKGQCLSYFVSDVFVNIALERSFAKVFELFGILLGASVGAGVAIIVYDFSYRTLINLCSLYLQLESSIKPNLAKNIDSSIVECLLKLPEEVFDASHKKQLCTITDHSIFLKKIIKDERALEDIVDTKNDNDNDNDEDNQILLYDGDSETESEELISSPKLI